MNESFSQDNREGLLTCIPQAYTVGDTSEPESEEMNELIVKNFIKTLAEVSLNIASRKVKEKI